MRNVGGRNSCRNALVGVEGSGGTQNVHREKLDMIVSPHARLDTEASTLNINKKRYESEAKKGSN